ncbi:hypothetical protein SLS57_006153 [Botryosphaeria dothidea]
MHAANYNSRPQARKTDTASIPAITLEEHFLTTTSAAKLGSGKYSPLDALSGVTGRDLRKGLIDVGSYRLQSMDEAKISHQVISHGSLPIPPTPSEAAAINNELYRTTKANPDRFVGFATLPMNDPVEAGKELKRAVTELGFVGALVDNHAQGKFYDDHAYWPIFEQAIELDVPIYIHPAFPQEIVAKAKYHGNYDAFSASCIGSWAYGWHSDIAVHILRLYASGFFDAHPKIKLVIGHMGETLPMMIGRIGQWNRGFSGAKRTFEDVWKKNIYVTTSGFFDVPPLKLLLDTLPADHIMYSVDYPFGSNEQGAKFLEQIEKEGVFENYGGEEAYRGFLRGNAEKLLKLREKGISS